LLIAMAFYAGDFAAITARADGPAAPAAAARANAPLPTTSSPPAVVVADDAPATTGLTPDGLPDLRQTLMRTGPTIALFAVASLVPAALLMATAFVRISVVLTLLRQALGSPQVPGNQVLSALALLLTALVMKPAAETVYAQAIEPFAAGRIDASAAWTAGSTPIKAFMVEQIYRTGHEHYLWQLQDQMEPPSPGRAEPTEAADFDLRVVAPAFLISELTTALTMGFAIYLPFLVIDLVVSAVLAAMGLVLLPPTLVAMPLKLVLFVLADGWMLVSGMLLRSFG
jgi:flagellar biosynthetic protein FliP